jgi:hypothetical protein
MLTGQALKEEALFTSKSGKTALNILIFKQLFHNSFNVHIRPNTGKDGDEGQLNPKNTTNTNT